MSLKDIRSECSDVAALLQPYVDGEVTSPEQEQVGAHLESCAGCRAAVSEQAWVRATLQAVERDVAPQALRAKVLLGLDGIDREHAAEAAAAAPPGLGSRIWSRVRDLGRGGLIMVPAGAVAVALFFMAREGVVTPEGADPSASPGYGLGSAILPGAEASLPHGDEDVMRAVGDLEPQVGFAVQMPTSTSTKDVQLVAATLDRGGASRQTPAARLRYQLGDGLHLIDRQLPAGSFSPTGTSRTISGRAYHMHRDEAGRPVISFESSGVAHVLLLEGASVPPGERGEYDLLLKFAAHFAAR
ncbi:MAG: zf-HC2 domain-containing protein [Deltaproteobacteria bacterium]|nr:zf-HC2 domain-containing protein [Deltaproteobacteria bacterium]